MKEGEQWLIFGGGEKRGEHQKKRTPCPPYLSPDVASLGFSSGVPAEGKAEIANTKRKGPGHKGDSWEGGG